MNTKSNTLVRPELVAVAIESLNAAVWEQAEATKKKIYEQTHNKAMAQAAHDRVVARGWNFTASVARGIAEIGE